MKTEDEPTRAIAGFILKNNAKVYYASFPAEIKSFIKQETIQAIGDPSPLIRATAGTLISTIAMRGELTNWPELLPTLCHFIEDPNYTMCEVMCTPLTGSVPYLLSGVDEKEKEFTENTEELHGPNSGQRSHTEDNNYVTSESVLTPVAEWIVCGDTEVSLEQLEDYVTDIRSLANEHTDNTNIELQFKVSGRERSVHMCTHLLVVSPATGCRQV